jgi:hypothetical protein
MWAVKFSFSYRPFSMLGTCCRKLRTTEIQATGWLLVL